LGWQGGVVGTLDLNRETGRPVSQLVALTRLLASPIGAALPWITGRSQPRSSPSYTAPWPHYQWTLSSYSGVRDPLVELLIDEQHRLTHQSAPFDQKGPSWHSAGGRRPTRRSPVTTEEPIT
jgi:hypothetical protein